jgi:hypothetical protein
VDEARVVLARLDRIDSLEREGGAPEVMLAELAELAREAAIWAEREGDARAREAVAALATRATVPA